MKTAVYPGTFDPLTMGHFDLLRRSSQLFDRVVLLVAGVSMKATSMFGIDERIAMIRETVEDAGIRNVAIDRLDCLLVDYCKRHGYGVVVRGLRVYSDFEYEFQMALTNRKLNPDIETLYMMPGENYSYVTASMIREVARYGGDTAPFVPPAVQRHVEAFMRGHPEQHIQEGSGVGNTGAFDR